MKQINIKYCTKCGSLLTQIEVEGKARKYCENCQTTYYDNPLPSVAVVVSDGNDRIVLVKRKSEPGKGKWSLPGGFINNGESAIQAALRELEEKTGLKGIINNFIKIFNHESDLYGHVIIITYEAGIIGGELRAGDDAERAEYFNIADIPPLAFPFQQEAVEQVFGCP